MQTIQIQLKRLFLTIVTVLAALVAAEVQDAFAQVRLADLPATQKAKSDALFAEGVDLYKAGKYAEAADLFTQSAELDDETVDPSSSRYGYSWTWVASCHYKMGEVDEAIEMSPYLYSAEPVDRRLTVESDALSDEALQRYNEGDIDGAERLLLQCGEIERSVLGEDHYYYAGTLNSIIDLYIGLGRETEEVEPLVMKALEINEKTFGKDSPAYAATALKLAKCRFAEGEYEESVSICEKSLTVLENVPGKEYDMNYIIATGDLADCLVQTERRSEAPELYTRALELTENAAGRETYDYVDLLDRFAFCNCYMENYPEALRLQTEAVDIVVNADDADEATVNFYKYDLAAVHSSYSEYLYSLQNFTGSLEQCTKAMQILDGIGMGGGNEYANALVYASQCRYMLENYDDAISAAKMALDILDNTDEKDHDLYITAANWLAMAYVATGDTDKAAEYTELAKKYAETSGNKKYDLYVMTVTAAEYSDKGDYEEAAALQTRALEEYRAEYGEDNMEVESILTRLAYYHAAASDYTQATRDLEQAVAILEKYNMQSSAEYATVLQNLSDYALATGRFSGAYRIADRYDALLSDSAGRDSTTAYSSFLLSAGLTATMTGEFTKADSYFKTAGDIVLKTKGEESYEYAIVMRNYCTLNMMAGFYQTAGMFARRSAQILANTVGTENEEYATALFNLGQCYRYEEDPDKAFETLKESVEIFERTGTTDNIYYYDALGDLAITYLTKGPSFYPEALEAKLKAAAAGETIMGREHVLYLLGISDLAYYYFLNRNNSEARECARKALDGCNEFIASNFPDMASDERASLWSMINSAYTFMPPLLAYRMDDPAVNDCAYDAVLMSKGFLLNSEIEISRLLLESGDGEAVSKYKDLQRNRMKLNRLYGKPANERKINADSLARAVKAQEVELVRLSSTYGNYTKNLTLSWKDVQKKLGKKDIAVEFLVFQLPDENLYYRIFYAALTLSAGDDSPHFIPLFSEEDLAEVVPDDYYTTPTLARLVWEPLAAELEGKKNVYFSPAGGLYSIAIESVPDYVDASGLVSDRLNFFRLSSTRSLAVERNEVEPVRADVYGGLKYTTGEQTLVNDFIRHGGKRSADFGTVNADSLGLRGGVSDLPGTLTEAEKIGKVIATTEIDKHIYTDTLGTETSLKFLSGKKPGILHIATHGFFWTETEAAEKSNLKFLGAYNDNSSYTQQTEDKALTRTGLLFAGANYTLSGRALPDGVDDGVLTAKEISTLDLRGLDLVVLSACQTGLGEITGDGVFGLQRGFKKAGANSIVMSLWKVDDDATQIFMAHFYYDLLCEKMTKRASFLDAQHYLRTTEAGKYDKPECWAAFILLDALD